MDEEILISLKEKYPALFEIPNYDDWAKIPDIDNEKANFQENNLKATEIRRIILKEANLEEADIKRAILEKAKLVYCHTFIRKR